MASLAEALGTRANRTSTAIWNAVSVVVGTGFIYLMTQVKVSLLPFSPVPITGQTLAILLVGGALGFIRGGASVLLYLALAALGLPRVSATGETGIDLFYASSPTGGYLLGFLFAAVVVGYLSKRGWDRSIRSSIGAMLLGSVVIYLFGVPWLANALDVPAAKALELGLYPFVVGDLLKLFIAAGLLPSVWAFVGPRQAPHPRPGSERQRQS
jgi:biotin transport system substrate-specific component